MKLGQSSRSDCGCACKYTACFLTLNVVLVLFKRQVSKFLLYFQCGIGMQCDGLHFNGPALDEHISPFQYTEEDSPDPCLPAREGGREGWTEEGEDVE